MHIINLSKYFSLIYFLNTFFPQKFDTFFPGYDLLTSLKKLFNTTMVRKHAVEPVIKEGRALAVGQLNNYGG